MLLDAMRVIQADGAAFVEAHPDLEVFRLRFGKVRDSPLLRALSVFNQPRIQTDRSSFVAFATPHPPPCRR